MKNAAYGARLCRSLPAEAPVRRSLGEGGLAKEGPAAALTLFPARCVRQQAAAGLRRSPFATFAFVARLPLPPQLGPASRWSRWSRWTAKTACKSMEQDENKQSFREESVSFIGKEPKGNQMRNP